MAASLDQLLPPLLSTTTAAPLVGAKINGSTAAASDLLYMALWPAVHNSRHHSSPPELQLITTEPRSIALQHTCLHLSCKRNSWEPPAFMPSRLLLSCAYRLLAKASTVHARYPGGHLRRHSMLACFGCRVITSKAKHHSSLACAQI